MSFSATALREAMAQIDSMNTQHLQELAAAVAAKVIQRKNEEHAAAVARCLAIAASVDMPIAELMATRRPYTRRTPQPA